MTPLSAGLRWRGVVARSALAAIVLSLLWSAREISGWSVIMLAAVMFVPVFALLAIVDVGGALLADERARNERAAAASNRVFG